MHWQTIRKVWNLLTPAERRRALGLLGLMIIGMLLEMLGIGLVVPFIALLATEDTLERWSLMRQVHVALGSPGKGVFVVMSMAALTIVFLVKNGLLALITAKQMRLAFDVQTGLSEKLFKAYLGRPYVFHVQHNSAEMLRNVITETSLFTNFVLIPGSVLVTEFTVLLGAIILLVTIEPAGALVTALVLGGAGLVFLKLARNSSSRWARERQRHDGLRLLHAQQGLAAVKDIKLLGRERQFISEFELHSAAAASASRKQMTFLQLPRLFLEILAIVCLTALLFFMLGTGRALEAMLPTVGLFAAAAFRLMPSAIRVISSTQSLRYGYPVIATLSDELGRIDADGSKVESRSEPLAFAREICVRDLHYSFPGTGRKVIDGISIEIRKGQAVGIVGASGAGKSTLVDLFLGLLEPDAGFIAVDGRDVRVNLRGWQDHIGYVPQSIYLTDDSIRRNVALGVATESIEEARVRAALQAAQLHEFVQSLPEGLDTFVGERGVRLSGGQRQRIGIARALYHQPSILVLDEATSSLDPRTEEDVMRAVQALHGEKTLIIVAHRLSTVAYCDHIYHLEGGRLAGDGPPETMLPPLNPSNPVQAS